MRKIIFHAAAALFGAGVVAGCTALLGVTDVPNPALADGSAGGSEAGIDEAGIDEAGNPIDAAQKDGGAADAGCVSFVLPAVADTYLLDDGNHCNGAVTFGNATLLHAEVSSPAEYALVRFAITGAQLAFLDSRAVIAVSTTGATCSAGLCAGNAYAMRSDWAEASGDSKGADLCRRDFPSFGWAAGLGQPLAQPADYDTLPAAAMSLSGSTWRSAPLPSGPLTARLSGDGGVGYSVSLLFNVASPAGALDFPAHDADGGMTMTVIRCE